MGEITITTTTTTITKTTNPLKLNQKIDHKNSLSPKNAEATFNFCYLQQKCFLQAHLSPHTYYYTRIRKKNTKS